MLLDNETILIIGGTGFIGQNLLDYYVNNDQVRCNNILVISRSLPEKMYENIHYFEGNYSDDIFLKRIFSKWKITKVFHLASSSIPVSSNQNIKKDIDDNLLATINLLDVMKEFSCRFILYISSGGAVYGEKKQGITSENELCMPISSYGIIKLTIEKYLYLYQREHNISYLILRISNPFGQFHKSKNQGAINIAARKAVNKNVFSVWGDGKQSKDYIYIKDLINIVVKLIEKKISNKTINIGSGVSIQLNTILNIIKSNTLNFNVTYVESKTSDVREFCLDISLLKSILNFEFTELDKAIRDTILWEKSQLK